MPRGFDIRRTMQAASVLLRAEERTEFAYIRLLKLLYHADRLCLARFGRPITGDHYVAMRHGPVLSETYRLLRAESVRTPEWEACFRTHGYTVRKVGEPGLDRLSGGEIETLQEVARLHSQRDDFAIVDWMHDEFAEWRRAWEAAVRCGAKSRAIPLESVVAEVGDPVRSEAVRREDAAIDAMIAALWEPEGAVP